MRDVSTFYLLLLRYLYGHGIMDMAKHPLCVCATTSSFIIPWCASGKPTSIQYCTKRFTFCIVNPAWLFPKNRSSATLDDLAESFRSCSTPTVKSHYHHHQNASVDRYSATTSTLASHYYQSLCSRTVSTLRQHNNIKIIRSYIYSNISIHSSKKNWEWESSRRIWVPQTRSYRRPDISIQHR